MGSADLHIHTIYSWDGTSSVSGVLKFASINAHLNVIAITDHDEIEGALQAIELAPSFGIEVIPGSEISTRDGHLLALFIHNKIPRGLTLEESVLLVREQGGICIAPHPGARGANSLSAESIRAALANPLVKEALLGIEIFNASIFHQRSNYSAWSLGQSLHLAWVGNSDSHILKTIGMGATRFPGKTALDVRQALFENTTSRLVIYKQAGKLGIIRAWVPLYILRRAGWVGVSAGPNAPIRLRRAS